MLSGQLATEQALREQAPQHRYLHLATHGFFAPPEIRSALAPRKPDERLSSTADLFGERGVVGFNPLLLSGIVLAGANRPPEADQDDGILTALDVLELDLSRVDLAMLSACETGLGEVAGGEGLLGLQRAFQIAGARTVVSSLWKVDDPATQALMSEFYRNLWERKLGKLESLRQAQISMLHNYDAKTGTFRGTVGPLKPALPAPSGKPKSALTNQSGDGRTPPFYWAAFVLSGDWR